MSIEILPEIQEAIAAIAQMNLDIYEATGQEDSYLEVHTDGICSIVQFRGMVLWCSEDDDREFNEGTNSYEPFIPFLKQKIREVLSSLSQLDPWLKLQS